MVSNARVYNDGQQVPLAELKRLTQAGNFDTFTSLKGLINMDTNSHIHFPMMAAHIHPPLQWPFNLVL